MSLRDWHLRDRDFAGQEALRLASTRDELTNKYRLGLATFNAASIVALLTAVGGAREALADIGFSPILIRIALAFFTVGVVAAGTSISATQNHLIERAGYAGARLPVLDRLISATENVYGDDGSYARAQKENQDLFKSGLADRPVARWAQHIASACWLGGVITLMLGMAGVA